MDECFRRAALGAALFLHAAVIWAADAPDPAPGYAEAVRAILPPGWTVTEIRRGVTPPGWHTARPGAGVLVAARGGDETLSVCFLPEDWVGIRTVYDPTRRGISWEGVLARDHVLAVVVASHPDLDDRARTLFGGMATPSLLNGDDRRPDRVFAGRRTEVDREASVLVRDHCTTPAELAEAGFSLMALGVSAESVLLRAAREFNGPNRDVFYSALGRLGGPAAVGALCEIVADRAVPDDQRKYAVIAVARHTDPRIAPALRTALREVRNEEAVGRVATELSTFRDAADGPALLTAFRRVENSYFKAEIAQALAAVRCREALPDLRRLAAETQELAARPGANEYARDLDRSAELAVRRLDGDWGTPGLGLRLMVVPPERAVAGTPIEVTVYAENIGSSPIWSWNDWPSGLEVDGQPVPVPKIRLSVGLTYQIAPGRVYTRTYDLSKLIAAPGRHTVRYSYGGARSAVVVVEVLPPPPKI